MRDDAHEKPQLRRVAPRRGKNVLITFDGEPITAIEGDSVLCAILSERASLRLNEFDGKPRAGFCAMGACQDCWVWTEGGHRLRACTTPAQDGMAFSTSPTILREAAND